MHRINKLLIATAIGSLMACGSSSPTAPKIANIAGSYDLTLTVSSTCSANLPAAARVLTYTAAVSQIGPAFTVTLTGPVVWNSTAVNGTASEQTITFANFSFSEATSGGGITLNGTGTVNVGADGSIKGALGGKFQTPAGATCTASDHQLQMIKK